MSSNSTFGKPFGGANNQNQNKGAGDSFSAYEQAFDKEKEKTLTKVNDLNKDIKYNHAAGPLGDSIGMTNEECGVMAAKFQLASNKAKAEVSANRQSNPTGRGYMSKTIEYVLPTLTPKELAFAVGTLIKDQMQFQRRLQSGDLGSIFDLLR